MIRKNRKPQIHSPHLDSLRAFAAFLVAFGHVRTLFFVDFGDVQAPTLVVKLFYFLTGFGFQSVLIFFVLSGLFVGRQILHRIHEKRWSWWDYSVQRFTRLLIVLWPALALTFLWDSLGLRLFRNTGIYSGDALYGNLITTAIAEKSSLWIYAANAFFLQGIVAPTAGSNGPLWSLSFEFWYYILFPLGILAVRSQSYLSRALYFVIGSFILYAAYLRGLVPGYVYWLLGAGTGWVSDRVFLSGTWTRIMGIFSLAFLIATLSLQRVGGIPIDLSFHMIVVSTAFLSFAILQMKSEAASRYSKTVTFFSNFSYTLYLVHLPFAVFLRALLVKDSRWQPTASSLFFAFLLIGVLYLYSYVVSRFTEAYTDRLRSLLFKRNKSENSMPYHAVEKAA